MICPKCGKEIHSATVYSNAQCVWTISLNDASVQVFEDTEPDHVECPECEQDITDSPIGQDAIIRWRNENVALCIEMP